MGILKQFRKNVERFKVRDELVAPLGKFFSLTKEERLTCAKDILESNNIMSIQGFILHCYPSLKDKVIRMKPFYYRMTQIELILEECISKYAPKERVLALQEEIKPKHCRDNTKYYPIIAPLYFSLFSEIIRIWDTHEGIIKKFIEKNKRTNAITFFIDIIAAALAKHCKISEVDNAIDLLYKTIAVDVLGEPLDIYYLKTTSRMFNPLAFIEGLDKEQKSIATKYLVDCANILETINMKEFIPKQAIEMAIDTIKKGKKYPIKPVTEYGIDERVELIINLKNRITKGETNE